MEGKVIGLGGIFLKFQDPSKMNQWYEEVLGMTANDYGVLFAFNTSLERGYLQLGTFPADSDYFGANEQKVMLNFRVNNMEKMIERLTSFNVPILNEVQSYEYGKFLHISDPEGNRIELWEAIDTAFDKEKMTEMR
jgi:predicted enzyme related to lactoylglutathione lyase